MQWIVSKDESGKKLIEFLALQLPSFSARALKRELESNFCKINGQVERFASKKIKIGDQIIFNMSGLEKPSEKPSAFEILFEDEYYKCINKPAGVLSEDLQELLVHRLDRDTSGVIVLPKTVEAERALLPLFKDKKVHKRYVALVDGIPQKSHGVINVPVGVKRKDSGVVIRGVLREGAPAETEWEVKKRGRDAALLYCYPKTGKTHQIRIHLSSIGHPILGDYTYCRSFRSEIRPPRQMLHAAEVRFRHPFTEKTVAAIAPLPEDFEKAILEME